MTTFDPTHAPAGRLARLGIVLDVTEPPDRVRGLAILCDRAGIDAVWLAGRASLTDPASWPDPRPVAMLAATSLGRARLGVFLAAGGAASDTAGDPASAQEIVVTAAAAAGRTRTDARGRARLGVVIDDLDQLAAALATADDVILPGWSFADLEAAADEVRAECAESGRDPATLGVAALLPVSIGRTDAEARARADLDPLFAQLGRPEEVGIFGTLEECQDRVIALAHAGISDLRCVLPANPDVHDVIAQVTGMAVGTTDVLIPGSLRSPAPPPPEGWGGRADVPPAPRVSGGSRRR